MSDLTITCFETAQRGGGRTGRVRLADALMVMVRTYRTRQALLELTPRELSDIGVSRATAVAEASRLPWDTAPIRDAR